MIMQMSMILVMIIFAVLIQGYQFENFYTFGDKLKYQDEGSKITSFSGYQSVIDIGSLQCARGCLSMKEACNCCNSFTYNTFRRECYFKLKQTQIQAENTVFNDDGWQTYKFDNLPGSFLVDSVKPYQADFTTQSHAYIHSGFNKLAINEGISLQTADNKAFLSRVTPDDCAQECNRIPNCNSFSYNPNEYGGACYLKQSLDSSRAVTDSSAGWRTYWKDSVEKCFCTCKSNVFCVVCNSDDDCFEG